MSVDCYAYLCVPHTFSFNFNIGPYRQIIQSFLTTVLNTLL